MESDTMPQENQSITHTIIFMAKKMKIGIYFGNVMNVTSRLFLDFLLEKVITSDLQQDTACVPSILGDKPGPH